MAEALTPSRANPSLLGLKIFQTFRLALDWKKLVLAAVGILAMSLVWLLLSLIFYAPRKLPEWKDYDSSDPNERVEKFKEFKVDRESWTLLHELAGTPYVPDPAHTSEEAKRYAYVDIADLARTYEDYKALAEIEQSISLMGQTVTFANQELKFPGETRKFPFTGPADVKPIKVAELRFLDSEPVVLVDNQRLQFEKKAFDELRTEADRAMDAAMLRAKYRRENDTKKLVYLTTYEENILQPKLRPVGRLRQLPWFEYRGQNPYLLVSDTIKNAGTTPTLEQTNPPWFGRFPGEQVPVLLEPLFKFLAPVFYLFDSRAGFWNRIYLGLGILATLAIWGFFGGAICRIAAVQFARNERLSLGEAVGFARQHFLAFFAAPVFPIAFLTLMAVCLILFGFVEMIPLLGDILVAGLFWPVVLFFGFLMAIVLVGLIGWPLMNATVSTEGSDSFDALSRSYSYVFQAPWHYLWYSLLAALYGALLIFFVVFMASLMAFLGKWAVSLTPGMTHFEREPSYLFVDAPTSLGWRDLFLHDSPYRENRKHPTPDNRYQLSDELKLNWYNRVGGYMVCFWIYLFFLLVIGFGYSYFWSASTVIYFLMRNVVDDTNLDEVHLDEPEIDAHFRKPAAPEPAAPAPKAGTISLTMIEPPAPASGSGTAAPPGAPVSAPLSTPAAAPVVVNSTLPQAPTASAEPNLPSAPAGPDSPATPAAPASPAVDEPT